MLRRLHLLIQRIIIFGFSAVFLVSCSERSMEGMILFTRVSGEQQQADYITGSSWRYLPGSSIVAMDPDQTEAPVTVLTGSYYSACAPDLSYDAGSMVFAGQKNMGEPWQIWEMDLRSQKTRQVTSSAENCMDPVYLPGGRIVFSKLTRDGAGNVAHALFTCNLDGSETKQITFNPNAYFASSVLRDGRVLSVSRELYPINKEAMLMVLRPDGTKAELFYKGLNGSIPLSRGKETVQGKIAMVEADRQNPERGKLITVDYNRPMHSRVDLSEGIEGSFHSLSPKEDGNLLVTYRASEKEPYGLFEFDPDSRSFEGPIYKDKEHHVIEAVIIEKRERPKKIPSEVNTDVDTGLLLCQDVNFSGVHTPEDDPAASAGVKMEILGLETSLGVVDVEKDGSVYLKIAADTPFQIQTLDRDGKVISGPGSWIYLRPNERRGCVGCHQGNEMVPDNHQPIAVLNEPVEIPKFPKLMAKTKVESE